MVSYLIAGYVFLLTMESSLSIWHFQNLAGSVRNDSIVNVHFKLKSHCKFSYTLEIINMDYLNYFSAHPHALLQMTLFEIAQNLPFVL